jgi:hypothetical protein
MKNKWKDNEVQFPRLIAEIRANVKISRNDWKALCKSMDLTEAEVDELFDRADDDWEFIKSMSDKA